MKLFYQFIIIISIIGIQFSFSEVQIESSPKTIEELGEKLFFDKILSSNQQISCATCHKPEFAFSDTVAFSVGVDGRIGKRNAPSCANITDRTLLFYDGRANSLEDQVQFPIEDANEMNLPIEEAVKRLKADKNYNRWFKKICKSEPNEFWLKKAIAAFERTLETGDSPFDRYMAGDSSAISESAKRGRELFISNRTQCFECHFSPDFTGDEFRNIGLFDSKTYNDVGRFAVTQNKEDIGKFKVPGLRNVAITKPYMHNGMFKTLREVIDYYNNPTLIIPHAINKDTLINQPLNLTLQEKIDLEEFLKSLTDSRFKN